MEQQRNIVNSYTLHQLSPNDESKISKLNQLIIKVNSISIVLLLLSKHNTQCYGTSMMVTKWFDDTIIILKTIVFL